MNYEEYPFIMGVFLNYMCPSKWVLFQTFNQTWGIYMCIHMYT